MKLSMYLLEDWFRSRNYNIQSAIHDGEPCLIGPRIADEATHKAMACISQKNADAGLVTIANGQDVIFVINVTASVVLNEANEAFEYYNAWEASLLRGAFQGLSLQDLLGEAQLAIMRPMLIKNSRMELVALTDSYGPQTHPLWAEYLRQFRPGRSIRYNIGRSFNEPVEVAGQREPQVAFSPIYHGNFMFANLWSDIDDRRVGYINAYENKRPFTQKDLQLMAVFQKVVNFYVNAKPDTLFSHSALEEYMQSALSGTTGRYQAQDIYRINGWQETDSFAVIVLRENGEYDRRSINDAQEELENEAHLMCGVTESGRSVYLANLNDYGSYDDLIKVLSGSTDPNRFVLGVSHAFSGLGGLNAQISLADMAARKALEMHFPVAGLRDAALLILADQLRQTPNLTNLLHPDYVRLKQLDEDGNTQFARTLFWYLYDNRSFMDAAVHMGVHRNTINYRINKIFEILGSDHFDAPRDRLLYMLTYLLEHPYLS